MSEESPVSAQEDGQGIDVASVDPQQFAQQISTVSDEQLREAVNSEMRGVILSEIFRRMEEHFRADAAQGVDAVIHWKITGAPEGGEDHWETVIKGGSCTCTNEPANEPRVTLQMDGVDFLKLVTGNANGPMLFMTGKLKIQGDIAFSARIQSLFTVPSGGPPQPSSGPPQPSGGAPQPGA
jgi:putative sterol carrier protein